MGEKEVENRPLVFEKQTKLKDPRYLWLVKIKLVYCNGVA